MVQRTRGIRLLACAEREAQLHSALTESIMVGINPRITCRLVCVFLLVHAVSATALAQKTRGSRSRSAPAVINSTRFAPVDAILRNAVEDKAPPGAVVIIGHNGKIVYRKAFGYRSLVPRPDPMTVDTVFDMASLTKCLA